MQRYKSCRRQPQGKDIKDKDTTRLSKFFHIESGQSLA